MRLHTIFIQAVLSLAATGLSLPGLVTAQTTPPPDNQADTIMPRDAEKAGQDRRDADFIYQSLLNNPLGETKLKMDSEPSWLVHHGLFPPPELPIPPDSIPLDAFAQAILDLPDNHQKMQWMQAFYLYALKQWPLEKTVDWFNQAAAQMAPPSDSPERHLLSDYLADTVYRMAWAGKTDTAVQLRQQWQSYIGANDPLDKTLEYAREHTVYPYYDRFGDKAYTEYLAKNPQTGPCDYLIEFNDQTQQDLLTSSHAAPAKARAERIKPILKLYQPAIMASCTSGGLSPREQYDALLPLAKAGLLNTKLSELLQTRIDGFDSRFAQVAGHAEIGLAALKSGNPNLAQYQLVSLNLGELLPEGSAAFKAYEAEETPYLAWGAYDISAERDERYALPESVPALFMACLSDKACRSKGFFTDTLDNGALNLGIYDPTFLNKLNEPENNIDTLEIIDILKHIFAVAECDERCQYPRVSEWVTHWQTPVTPVEKLDLVAPWFANLPYPKNTGEESRINALVYLVQRTPQATALHDDLLLSIQQWESEFDPDNHTGINPSYWRQQLLEE